MSKFAAIQKQLEQASGRKTGNAPTPVPTPAEAPVRDTVKAAYKAPSRDGKIHIGAYLPADFKRSLRLVQAQTGEDTQTLIARALNDLFKAHNVPVIDQD